MKFLFKIIIGTVFSVSIIFTPALSDLPQPYYYCAISTQDGMLFSGGNYNLKTSIALVKTHCGTNKYFKASLLKQVMDVDENNRITNYKQ